MDNRQAFFISRRGLLLVLQPRFMFHIKRGLNNHATRAISLPQLYGLPTTLYRLQTPSPRIPTYVSTREQRSR